MSYENGYQDVAGQGPCPGCGTLTWFLAEDECAQLCEQCVALLNDKRAQFKAKLQEMRETKSLPSYHGPRAANS